MNHNDYVQLFEGFAKTHKDLRHEEVSNAYPTGKRKSFFRANGDEELIQSLGSQADTPLMLLKDYNGQLRSDNDMSVDDVMYGAFMILMHADNYDFVGIDNARDTCKKIGYDIIAEMTRLMLDDGTCGPIDNFSVSSVRYEFVGPFADGFYGAAFYFNFTEEAFHINTIDLDTAFRRN